ncbi:helix-turn-helix transcriptional regulator [Candidatus Dojkabacteria bacterium]|nr:helix-turn-helix transcriptional regulator [Candidatus Dojkabacteria bacterium]
MKNKEHKNEFCPLIESAKMLGDTATLLIINCLGNGSKRYNEIQSYVNMVSEATLADRLKKLQTLGLIERKQYECIPPKVEYSLTAQAKPLADVIDRLRSFGEKYFKV